MRLFLDYDEADRSMARLLKEADDMGVFAKIVPEKRPLMLFGFAEERKAEMLNDPDEGKRAAWLRMRMEYLASLDEFLYGPSEMTLVNSYEDIMTSQRLGEAGLLRLQEMRDRVIRVFVAMREKHRDLVDLRAFLSKAVDASFCIMGPAVMASGGTSIAESSALLANTLLTGSCVTPGERMYLLLWPLLASLAALACIFLLKPLMLLITGIGMTVINGAAFGTAFVLTGYWIDPFIPMGACFFGTLILFICRFSIGHSRELRFRLAYAPYVDKDTLKALVKAGRPLPSEALSSHAAIIAVKKPGMLSKEDRAVPQESKKTAAKFREDFIKTFTAAGAVVLGFEGDVALACFGSPLERVRDIKQIGNCSKRAANMVERLLKIASSQVNGTQLADCRFGIETGDCVFSWSSASGYTANGRAVIRARLFASLAQRCHVRAIIGESAKQEAGILARRLSSLNVNADGFTIGTNEDGNFYELPVGR
jgi:class 3 adenylate cyclase